MVNVYHVKLIDGGSGAADEEYRALIQAWVEDLYTEVKAFVSDLVQGRVIELYNVTDDTPEAPLEFDPTWGGGASGQLLPQGVAAFVFARTNTKRVQGRKYLPVFTESANEVGSWGTTTRTAMVAFGTRWAAGFIAAGGESILTGVYHKSTGTLLPIVNTAIRTDARYQRRRIAGRGS
jgi:hypothetical protein